MDTDHLADLCNPEERVAHQRLADTLALKAAVDG